MHRIKYLRRVVVPTTFLYDRALMMKGFILLIFFAFLLGCSRKESVTPFSHSEDYRARLRKTFTVRYPLMPERVGSYSYGDVIEMDPKRKNLLQYITKPLKEAVYQLGVKYFKRNKIQAQAELSIPPEAFEYIKSVKLKRIFFVLDTCIDHGTRCLSMVEGIKMTFIKSLFINLEPLKQGAIIQEIKEVDEDIFLKKEKEFFQNFGKAKKISNDVFQLAAHSQKKRPNNASISSYYIFKHHKNIRQLQKYLNQSRHIKKTTLFGDLILAEFKKLPNANISRIFHEESFHQEFKSQYTSITPATCGRGNCTELRINSENLVEYLKKHPNVIINTFIQVNKLPKKDFHYKGFIEFDVELNI